jgi:hypothetical protein
MIEKDVSDPNPKIDPAPHSNTEKEPDDWVSGRSRQSEAQCASVSAMSRAFVKETDAGTEELPDRPVSSHRNFVTENGLATIEASINRFEAAYRAAIDKGNAQAATEVVRPSSDSRVVSFGMTVDVR